jgi:hypothetical protein
MQFNAIGQKCIVYSLSSAPLHFSSQDSISATYLRTFSVRTPRRIRKFTGALGNRTTSSGESAQRHGGRPPALTRERTRVVRPPLRTESIRTNKRLPPLRREEVRGARVVDSHAPVRVEQQIRRLQMAVGAGTASRGRCRPHFSCVWPDRAGAQPSGGRIFSLSAPFSIHSVTTVTLACSGCQR